MTTLWQAHISRAAGALVLIAGAFGLLAGGFAADTHEPTPDRTLSAVAQIVFRGKSTLHDFEGRVMSQPFVLSISSNSWSAQADVLGGDMTTSNDRRDRNMWIMLETNSHPRLSGAVHKAALPPPAGTNMTLTLRIRDQQFEQPVTITDWSESPEGVRFHAAWEVSLKQYSIKPPSVLGLIRVSDTVRLEAQVTASNAATAPQTTNATTAIVPKS
jgi:hypothetical protein